MKLAVFSDLHAHPFAQYARVLASGRNSRLQDALDAIATVRGAAVRAGARAAVFGGDLFHTMGRIDVTTLNGVFAEIVRFADEDLPVFLLVGNHDQADKSGKRHSLEVFKALGHVVVMDQPAWYTHPRAPGLGVYAIPYCEDTNHVRALLGEIPPAPAGVARRLLLLHAGFDGARTGPHEYRMASELAVGDVPDGFDFVLSGHYHLPQWMDERRHIAYIGATTHQSWGDVNQPRGYAIADLAAHMLERFASGAPRFLRLCPEDVGRAREGDFVELVVPQEASDDAVQIATQDLERRGIGAHQVVRAPAPAEAPIARLPCGRSTDLAALIEPYVEHVAREPGARPPLVALGRSFLEAADA